MLRAAITVIVGLAGLTGCNFEQLGEWKPITDRAGRPHAPGAHSRGPEIRRLCATLAKPDSDLCKGLKELGTEKKTEGAH